MRKGYFIKVSEGGIVKECSKEISKLKEVGSYLYLFWLSSRGFFKLTPRMARIKGKTSNNRDVWVVFGYSYDEKSREDTFLITIQEGKLQSDYQEVKNRPNILQTSHVYSFGLGIAKFASEFYKNLFQKDFKPELVEVFFEKWGYRMVVEENKGQYSIKEESITLFKR